LIIFSEFKLDEIDVEIDIFVFTLYYVFDYVDQIFSYSSINVFS